MQIISLRAENVKRLRAVEIIPPIGKMVKITGRNAQGKTSVLDSIMWALGGTSTIPGKPIREGEKSAVIRLALGDKGLTELLVERRITEKTETLFVRNADGSKRDKPQDILNALIGKMAFDPIGFMDEKPADQLATLRRLVPLQNEDGTPLDVAALDKASTLAFQERTDLNRDAKSAQARADGIAVPADLPEAEPDTAAIMAAMAQAQARNREIDQHGLQVQAQRAAVERAGAAQTRAQEALQAAQRAVEAAAAEVLAADEALATLLQNAPGERQDEAVFMAELAAANGIRDGIKARDAKIAAQAEATVALEAAAERTAIIDANTATKAAALARAKMPVEGLSFGDGVVLFNGIPLDQASDAEQLRVSIAIAAALNPTLRIMRVRNGNLLDSVSMAALEQFGADNDFQIWIELVDETGEVGIVIEDGGVKGQTIVPLGEDAAPAEPAPSPERQAKADTFLAEHLGKLEAVSTTDPDGPRIVEELHAKAKLMLKAFPSMIAEKWNPVYLAKRASLKPRAHKE